MKVTLLSLGQSVDGKATVRAERNLGPQQGNSGRVTIEYQKNVHKFVFRLQSEEPITGSIILKREEITLEAHELAPVHGYADGYMYETKALSKRNFGQLNLGLLDLDLYTKKGLYKLNSINFIFQDFSKKNLNSLYQVIADSDWLDLFCLNPSNSMLPWSDYDSVNSRQSFWLVYSRTVRFVSEAEHLFVRNKLFLTVVQQRHKQEKYLVGMQVSRPGINMLVRKPEAFVTDPSGIIQFGVNRYSPKSITSSTKYLSRNLPENETIVRGLVKAKLLLAEYIGMGAENDSEIPGPIRAVREIVQRIDVLLHKTGFGSGIHNQLKAPVTLSRRLSDSRSHRRLLPLLLDVLDDKNLTSSGSKAHPTQSLDKLWELYCLDRIVGSLEGMGFEIVSTEFNRRDVIAQISLQKDATKCDVYFEPKVDRDSSPLRMFAGHNPLYYTPDYVIDIAGPTGRRVGIMDAKFWVGADLNPKHNNQVLNHDSFWVKYGLFIRKASGASLDFVVAIFPNTDNGEEKRKNFDLHELENQPNFMKMQGIGLKMSYEIDASFHEYLADLFFDNSFPLPDSNKNQSTG